MITVYYRKQSFSILLDGQLVKDNCFTLNDYQKHSLLALPLNDCERMLPLCGSVSGDTSSQILLTSNFDFIAIKSGEYELVPIFVRFPLRRPAAVLAQRSYNDVLATLYYDGEYELILENADNFINHTLPHSVASVDFLKCDNLTLIVLSDSDYLLIVAYDKEDFYILLERNGCKATLDGGNLRLSYEFTDTMRRVLTENYRLEDGEYRLVSRDFAYRIRHKYISELLPVVLIDALMVGDYSFASGILAPDLTANIDGVANFFGNVLCFYNFGSQPVADKCLRLLVLEDGVKVARSFKFEYDNSHITNIELLDEK